MKFLCVKCNYKEVEKTTDMAFETGSPWHRYSVECHGEKECFEVDRYVRERVRSIHVFPGKSQITIDDLF